MKPGRNDPCPCGSGKTYGNCCQAWREGVQPNSSVKKAAPTASECSQLAALLNAGRLVELESRARLLLEQYPDSGLVWNLLGISLQMQGKDGLPALRNAAKFLPNDAEVHSNLGNALSDLGRLDEAGTCYRKALQINPYSANVHSNLGVTLNELGRQGEAEISYRRALLINPNVAEVHVNLGNTLGDLGRLDEAEASYRRALQIKPNIAEAYSNLGNILHKINRLAEAETYLRWALKIEPDFAKAHNNLGNVLRDLGQLDDAVASYRRALDIKPDYAEAYSNLLFTLNYSVSYSPLYCLEQARQYGRMVEKKVGVRFSSWQCAAQPDRLRVGFVSGDLRNHSVGHFLESLLAHIAPDRLELIAYPTQHKTDELTDRIKPCFAAWKPLLGLDDEAAARLIHADGVHVLFDLSGHTAHNRLPIFAWKPAPVQVTWLGLPATTGMPEMDYVLGDSHAIPPECENHFSETVWRMPESCLCFTVPHNPVNVAPLPALATGYVTFGSFNNLTKVNDAVVGLWARVLKSVPQSRLLLRSKQMNDLAVRERILQRFASCGIAPGRLLLGGTLVSTCDHLAEYNKVDVALDTFPYPGVTTSVEALWMGVPVLALRGDRFLSRTAESIAYNAGLPDWVAVDGDDYVAKAVAHTKSWERLASLRADLRQQVLASPLFDAPRFARNLEAALWEMWQRYQTRQGIPL